jgi:hypothetical protein
MLEGKYCARWVRSFMAVSLAVLFSFGSLTPLAAGAFTPATRCGNKTQCCCRRAHRTDGPAVSSRACQSDCGRVTLGGTGIAVYAAPRTATAEPLVAVADRARPSQFSAYLLPPAGSHRQRPPPSLFLA